ncbi:MAG: alanine--tRNA ligase [Clostridia bacterium]|nr:alanine--tRNA ligase [Clostridia bacterium]
MQWTSLNDLREKYLSFFESKGHLRLESFPLVPKGDKSLLLINSGMAPMKKYFTGEVTPPRNRVTTCQKCIRTPDLERVGHTARHGTYFEMLGNFSFGDYFKHEAIKWAWEFLTETLEIPSDLLWPSVYEEDDEAYAIWRDEIGVREDHIVKLGKEDNFWEHGTGPCGPCSEIYFDRGEKYGCGKENCRPGCDCDRYMEIWNNVFSQFNNMGDGTYTELEHKNIDTGMGLERLACVMQGVDNMFEVDSIKNTLNEVCRISGEAYGKGGTTDISIRAITDHTRAATFMISDGIIPSNEGRGYVLRRLLRRAARHGRLLGVHRPFLCEIADSVINENKAGYPEIYDKREIIKKVILSEEESFAKTIDQGLTILNDLMKPGGELSGEDAFRLYDTYGFPLDLTKDILAENGMTVDESGFDELMLRQRELARNARKAEDGESWSSNDLSFDSIDETEFLGYGADTCDAKILDIIVAGEHTNSAEDENAILVLDKTVFYAESGGQVADTGEILASGSVFTVNDVKKNSSGIFTHSGTVEGKIAVDDTVKAQINKVRRNKIRANHTAAHLLQATLREVLGAHVEQAGQLVNDKEVRFDFTHFSALSAEEIRTVEEKVNSIVLSGIEVLSREMPIEEAKKLGAMALFGEKYGSVVRVVSAGDFSIEFCGGTHVDNTGKIGLFKITSETGIAAGVRRITAVTGSGFLKLFGEYEALLKSTAEALKCAFYDLPQKAEAANNTIKENQRQIEAFKTQLAAGKATSVLDNCVNIGGIRVASAAFDNIGADELRKMADSLRDKNDDIVLVLAAKGEGKITLLAAASKKAVDSGVHAGNLVRQIAEMTGGRGGGKPDMAMAGGKDISKLDDALSSVNDIVKEMLK